MVGKLVFVIGVIFLLNLVSAVAGDPEWKSFSNGEDIDFCAQADRTCSTGNCLYCVSYDEDEDCYNSLPFNQCDGAPSVESSGIDEEDEKDDKPKTKGPTVSPGLNTGEINNSFVDVQREEKEDISLSNSNFNNSNVFLIVALSGFSFIALGFLLGLVFYGKMKKSIKKEGNIKKSIKKGGRK
jgi:hypothetical protein